MTPPTGLTRPAPVGRPPPVPFGICPIIPLPGLAPMTPPEGIVIRPLPAGMPGLIRPDCGVLVPLGSNPPPDGKSPLALGVPINPGTGPSPGGAGVGAGPGDGRPGLGGATTGGLPIPPRMGPLPTPPPPPPPPPVFGPLPMGVCVVGDTGLIWDVEPGLSDPPEGPPLPPPGAGMTGGTAKPPAPPPLCEPSPSSPSPSRPGL